MADPNVRLALRIHDECNGELVLFLRLFISGLCSCDLWGSTAALGRLLRPNLHPKLTPHHSGSDVFGSDICTWYVKNLTFNAILQIEMKYFRSKCRFSSLQLSYNNRSANFQKSSTAVLT